MPPPPPPVPQPAALNVNPEAISIEETDETATTPTTTVAPAFPIGTAPATAPTTTATSGNRTSANLYAELFELLNQQQQQQRSESVLSHTTTTTEMSFHTAQSSATIRTPRTHTATPSTTNQRQVNAEGSERSQSSFSMTSTSEESFVSAFDSLPRSNASSSRPTSYARGSVIPRTNDDDDDEDDEDEQELLPDMHLTPSHTNFYNLSHPFEHDQQQQAQHQEQEMLEHHHVPLQWVIDLNLTPQEIRMIVDEFVLGGWSERGLRGEEEFKGIILMRFNRV
jgi:hypothetical protein